MTLGLAVRRSGSFDPFCLKTRPKPWRFPCVLFPQMAQVKRPRLETWIVLHSWDHQENWVHGKCRRKDHIMDIHFWRSGGGGWESLAITRCQLSLSALLRPTVLSCPWPWVPRLCWPPAFRRSTCWTVTCHTQPGPEGSVFVCSRLWPNLATRVTYLSRCLKL